MNISCARLRYAVVIFVCLLFVAPRVSAQRVTLPRLSVTLAELFNAIERQTDFEVMFYTDNVSVNQYVTLPARQGSALQLLGAVLPKAGYTWQVLDRDILVRPAAEPAVVQQAPPKEAHIEMDLAEIDSRPLPETRQALVAPPVKVAAVVPEPVSFYKSPESYFENRLPRFALKTNLLYGAATLSPNLGVEFGLGRRTSLELHGGINPWRLQSRIGDNKKLAHVFGRAEFRYWLCERFNGHFFGAHGIFAQYNIGSHDIPLLFEKEFRYDGIAWGGGITYGYFLPFAKHWGVEFSVGAGVMRLDYDRFECSACERSSKPGSKTYFGPTRAGVTLVFNIK